MLAYYRKKKTYSWLVYITTFPPALERTNKAIWMSENQQSVDCVCQNRQIKKIAHIDTIVCTSPFGLYHGEKWISTRRLWGRRRRASSNISHTSDDLFSNTWKSGAFNNPHLNEDRRGWGWMPCSPPPHVCRLPWEHTQFELYSVGRKKNRPLFPASSCRAASTYSQMEKYDGHVFPNQGAPRQYMYIDCRHPIHTNIYITQFGSSAELYVARFVHIYFWIFPTIGFSFWVCLR